jgi:hypothetical protein
MPSCDVDEPPVRATEHFRDLSRHPQTAFADLEIEVSALTEAAHGREFRRQTVLTD